MVKVVIVTVDFAMRQGGNDLEILGQEVLVEDLKGIFVTKKETADENPECPCVKPVVEMTLVSKKG